MKSLTIASLASALCALWLSNYVAEGKMVKITKCEITRQMDGSVDLKSLDVENDKIVGSNLEVLQELNAGLVKVQITVTNEDDNVMFDQNVDLCSMSSNDLFKNYFQSFSQPEFNEGNCPIQPGSYSSGEFDINVDEAPEGIYKGTIGLTEESNEIMTINCETKIE